MSPRLPHKTTQEPPLAVRNVDFDGLLNDVFGWNLLGLRSLWATIRRPRAYFNAAHDQDWEGKYAPAFRVWFALIAITFFFQFFWGAADSPTAQSLIAQFEAAGTLPDTVTPRMAALEVMKWNFTILPFAMIACSFALAALVPLWGRGTSFVMRQRYVFLSLIPGAALTLPMTIALGSVPVGWLPIILIASYVLTTVLNGMTAWRGHLRGLPKGGLRAVAFAIAALIASVAASIIANVGSALIITSLYM